jgi:hypothetical protein
VGAARRVIATAIAAVAVIVSLASSASAQTADPPPTLPAIQAPERPPNLDRIREAVSKPPEIKISDGQLRIYVEVIAKWPRFDELMKGYDLMNGPVARGNPMSHAEFLNMVTPRELHSSGGIKPTEILTMALVNWAGKAVITKGLEAISNAKSQREIDEIRARIDRELAALRGAR